MKTKILILALVGISAFFSCSKSDSDENSGNEENKTIKKQLNGFAQKGPFVNGSSVMIFELDNSLDQTGKVYNTTIADNSGKFEKKNVELSSSFVLFKADGFYFNEVANEISGSQLTLYAITDLSKDSAVNVNVLTHLERSRIEYLVLQEKKAFADAKKQAQKEVLDIFNISKPDITSSEKLSLVKSGDDNAILLAVSVILQGKRTSAEMSELLANIITDIKADGILNDSTLGSKLIEDVKYMDLAAVRANLIKRYQELNESIEVPDFEKYVKSFINNTKFKPKKSITYPYRSKYGFNLLSDSVTTIDNKSNWDFAYSMSANVPDGYSLKIVLKGGLWWYRVMPNGPVNWDVSSYDSGKEEQTFEVKKPNINSDISIQLPFGDTITIEYYENNAVVPTKIKKVFCPETVTK
ncbi:MAG TPA: hypothetical protein PK252_08730 [Bacteroidales bacterium]|nr:hypothetical protein [Bacteroidales bacterium]